MSYSTNFLTNYYLTGCQPDSFRLSNFEKISPKQEGEAAKLHSILAKNPTRKSPLDSGNKRTLPDGTEEAIMYTPEEVFRSKRKKQGRTVSLRLNEPSERYPNLTRQQQFDNAINIMQNADNKRILSDVNLVNSYENNLRTSRFDPNLEQRYLEAKRRLTSDPDIGVKLSSISNAYDDVDHLRSTSQPANVKVSGLKTRVKDSLNKQLKAQGKDISVDNAYLNLDDSGLTIPSYVDKNTLKGKGAGGTNYDPVVYRPTIKQDRATSRVRNKITQVVNDIGLTNNPELRRPITPQYVLNKGIIDTRDTVNNARLNTESAVNSKLNQVRDIVDKPLPDLARDAGRVTANSLSELSNVSNQIGNTISNVVDPIKNTVSNIRQKISNTNNTKPQSQPTEATVTKPPIQSINIPESQKQQTIENTWPVNKKGKKVPIKRESYSGLPNGVTTGQLDPNLSNVEKVKQLLESRNTENAATTAANTVKNSIPTRLLKNKAVLGGGLAAAGGLGLLGLANSLANSNVSDNQLRQQQLYNQRYDQNYYY